MQENRSRQDYSYIGNELDIFAHAANWKRYWAGQIAPYIGTHVLEVGAGGGVNLDFMATNAQAQWIALEPDLSLAASLRSKIESIRNGPAEIKAVTGTLDSLPADSPYDTILYIDVLEHIEADQAETESAYRLLSTNGHLIILSPAHQFLYSPFDQGIGHFRRYSRQTLKAAGPKDRVPLRLFYLDSVGFFASLANRILLRKKLPTLDQIRFWDRYLVRASAVIDPLLGFSFGKTIVGIWKKEG